jgi:hypothetical protein
MWRPCIADSGATSIWIVIMRIPGTNLHIYTPKKKREKEVQRQKEWDEVLKPSSSRPPATEQRPRHVKPLEGMSQSVSKPVQTAAQKRSPHLPPEVMNQIVDYVAADAAAGDVGARKGINNLRATNKAVRNAWDPQANVALNIAALKNAAFKSVSDPENPLLPALHRLSTLPPKGLEQVFDAIDGIEARLGLHWQGTTDSSGAMAVALRQTVAALPPERGAEILRVASHQATGQRLLDLIGNEQTSGTMASMPAENRVHALQDLVNNSALMPSFDDRQAVVQAVDALPAGIGDDLKAKVSRT